MYSMSVDMQGVLLIKTTYTNRIKLFKSIDFKLFKSGKIFNNTILTQNSSTL